MCLPNAENVFKVESEWEHAGLQCAVVVAVKGGHRCGYVRVPPTHKFHGKGYYEEGSTDAIKVHGGLTFAQIEPCAHDDGQGWWFGFDCAHAGDEAYDPSNPPEWRVKFDLKHPEYARLKDHYWTQPEVEEETNRLADQLARLA